MSIVIDVVYIQHAVNIATCLCVSAVHRHDDVCNMSYSTKNSPAHQPHNDHTYVLHVPDI